jgi:alpha-1,3/alpha-1,6-mannosyltransferase
LCVSRFARVKQQDFVLRAFELFCRQRTDFTLVLLGPDPIDERWDDGESFLSELSEYVTARKLPVVFRIGANWETVLEYYSQAYACLFAAKNEDFGLVPLEAMASGKPVISIDEGGPRETILQGTTGFLVRDEEEMADKMLLLAGNPAVAKDMGLRGRGHVKKHFDDSEFLQRFSPLISRSQPGRKPAT